MIDAQYTCRQIHGQEIQPWSEDQIHALVREAFHNPSSPEGRILAQMQDVMFRPSLHTVARFLGEVPDISGAPIGAPRRPAMWMYLLCDKFKARVLPQIHEIYMFPRSDKETTIRALQIYFWTWVENSAC